MIYNFSKRLFDIVMSGMALLVLTIPFLIVMAILRGTGEGKVWYFQERIGHQGRRFRVLKFVTMRSDSEVTLSRDITLRNDPRVLPVGRILRMTKINELPQLINILKGDMSIVGWRPLTPRPFGFYPPAIRYQIVQCVPGLTGVGSIVFRDEEGIISRMAKAPEEVYQEHISPYKGELELWYQHHRSFWLDLKIIFLTAWVIFVRHSRLYEKILKDLPKRPATLDAPGLAAASQVPCQAFQGDMADRIVASVRRVLGNQRALLHGPCMEGNAEEYVRECVKTAWVSTSGAFVTRFEAMLEQYTGAKYAIATVNGTCALHCALHMAGVTRDDEVLCPSLTFVATANAVSFCNAIPHFCDVDHATRGLDPQKLHDHLLRIAVLRNGTCFNRQTGRRIPVLLVMHTFGHPANMKGLLDVAGKWNLAIVEDAAASLGSFYRGAHTGLFGKMGILSFNSNKIITTGGGGAILTNDPELGEKAAHLTSTGKVHHPWEFLHDVIAWNYRMPNINAALGCAQMERINSFRDRKRKLASLYMEAFRGDPDVTIMREPEECQSNYWLNALLLNKPDASTLQIVIKRLHESGFLCRPVWHPMHQLDIYSKCPRMDMAVTEELAARIINLPSSPILLS